MHKRINTAIGVAIVAMMAGSAAAVAAQPQSATAGKALDQAASQGRKAFVDDAGRLHKPTEAEARALRNQARGRVEASRSFGDSPRPRNAAEARRTLRMSRDGSRAMVVPQDKVVELQAQFDADGKLHVNETTTRADGQEVQE